MQRTKQTVLSIAGSDPSGGAGIQADLKAFTFLGVHGTTVTTCVTAQNTQRVKTIHTLPIDLIKSQIDVIFEEMQPDAIKTGLLYDKEIVKTVANKIKQHKIKTVIDPVLIATSGDDLLHKNFINTFKNELISKAYIITPNIPEAEILSGKKIKTISDIKEICSELYKKGSKYVFIKGGHLKGRDARDVLFNGKKFTIFSLPWISNKIVHGSGCTLSALIAGLLALGEKPEESIRKAKHMLWDMINKSYRPGAGVFVPDISPTKEIDIPLIPLTTEKRRVWFSLKNATENLLSFLPVCYIPEVGINIGYAIPNAKKFEEVCAINGRIIKTNDKPLRCGSLSFGSSQHIAAVILTAMRFDSEIRCGMNLKYTKSIIEKCKTIGFKIGSFDRGKEPTTKRSTMTWGTREAIKQFGALPDLIYDTGGIGKEPMIRILGRNPEDIIKKIYMLVVGKPLLK